MINKIRFLILIQFILIGCKTNDHLDNLPNIIIIYTDDLGYGDLSAYGKGTFNTPNIERLANEGGSVLRIGNISRVNEELLMHTLEAKLGTHPESKTLKKIRTF